jgi:hypothetical protein
MIEKFNLNKKKIMLLFILVSILVFAFSEGYKRYTFYRDVFNWTAYSTISRIRTNSDYIVYMIDEIENTQKTNSNVLTNFNNFYYDMVSYIQELENFTNQRKLYYDVNLEVFREAEGNIRSLTRKYSNIDGEFSLEASEIQSLVEMKVPFQAVVDAISEKMIDIDKEKGYGKNNVLKGDLWVEVLKNIDMKLKEL